MLKTINYPVQLYLKWKYPLGALTLLLCLMGCEPTQDQEKEKLREGLEIGHERLYEDEKGYAHYAFFVKNNNEKTIKSAKLSLFLLGSSAGMFPNEVRFENLAAGDSIYLSINLFTDFTYKQGYHFSSKVEEIIY